MSTRMPCPVRLTIHHNHGSTQELELDRPLITIGKLSTSTVVLTDLNVSRKHCVLERTTAGRWRITDLGSTNGTQVNGVSQVQGYLKDGDAILVGETRIEVALPRAQADAASLPELPPVPSAAIAQSAPAEVRGLGRDSFYDKRKEQASGPPVVNVALLWGDTLLKAERFAAHAGVRIGEADGCDLTIPMATLGREHFELIQPSSQGPVLQLSLPGVAGDVLVGDELLDAAEMARTSAGRGLLLAEGTKARLYFGEFTLLIGYERAPARPKVATYRNWNLTPLTFIVASAILHLSFLALSALMPEDPLKSIRDPDRARQRLVRVINVTTPPEDRPVLDPDKPEDVVRDDSEQLALEDNNLPTIDEPRDSNAPETLVDKLRKHQRRTASKSDPSITRNPMTRKLAKRIAKSTGVHAALTKNSSLMRKILASRAVDGTEIAMVDRGSEVGESTLMTDVFGPGDDLVNDPRNWLDRPGDKTGGDPNNGPLIDGLDKQKRRRDIDIKKEPKESVFTGGKPTVGGSREKAVVAKRIRRYLSGIRWCLRHDLQAGVAETGKAKLSFKIGPNGRTFNIKVTGAGTDQFQGCAVNKIQRWKFGAVEMGGVTTVNYPVVLKIK